MVWVNQDGVTGLHVPPKSPDAIADAITRICSDEALYRDFAHHAKERFDTMFTRETMIDAFHALYEELLEAPQKENV
jgi:rhamnosyl/mannosyltransferase